MKKRNVFILVAISFLVLTFILGEFFSSGLFKISGKATVSGENSKTVNLGGISYDLKLIAVTSLSTANIAVNDIQKSVSLGGTYSFLNNLNVAVTNIIYEAYAGGLQSITLNLSRTDSMLIKTIQGNGTDFTFNGNTHVFNITSISGDNVSVVSIDGVEAYLSVGDTYDFGDNLDAYVKSVTINSSGTKFVELNVSKLYNEAVNLVADTGTYIPSNKTQACTSNYSCNNVGECLNNSQEQVCIDLNGCSGNKTQTINCFSIPVNNTVNSTNSSSNNSTLEMCNIGESCNYSPGFFEKIWNWIRGIFGGK